jgi:ribosomal protein S18 acetylase RimI-like enzyme
VITFQPVDTHLNWHFGQVISVKKTRMATGLKREAALVETEIRRNCSGVDWKEVSETLRRVGMSYGEPDFHRKAFENSHTTVFVYHGSQLIGFGRAISDGVCQAAIYDVAVVPEFQKKGVGTTIIKHILDRLAHCNIILYASPGKEGFYKTLGMRKMKTGMALFINAEDKKQRGFTE